MKRGQRLLLLPLSLALGLGLGSTSVQGEVIENHNAAVNQRFSSGYGNTELTAPPVRNTSPSFLAAGYDLSPIGWNTKAGLPAENATANRQSIALISPMFYAGAVHFPITPSNGGLLTFQGADGQLNYTSTAEYNSLLRGDALLGRLAAPLPPSAQVSYYPILDLGNSPSAYANQPLLVYGWYGVIGKTTIAVSNWTSTTGGLVFYNGGIGVRGGDSGSPSLIPYDGQLTLAGTRYSTNSTTGYSGGGDESWYNPYVIRAANAAMAPYGYAVKVIAVPTKTWSGATNGNFSTASNWTQGAAPNREGIAFDAASANGHYAINLAGAGSIKGITFTPTAGNGFTFASGSTLQLGTGGIINNSPQTQTFNNAISMAFEIEPWYITGGQHWSANNGNLVINGAVNNNGFQLVVDGRKDTVINGVLSGDGGLGKEGTGKLTVTAANNYKGKTFLTDGILAVNNTSGSGLGTGQVMVNSGTLAGNGTIGAAVVVKSGGTLSPGNADLDQRGILTVNNSVGLSAGSRLAVHLNGLTAGSGYDQLLVGGTSNAVTLGGATLDLSYASELTGSIFWIIRNDSAGLLSGTFDGLADGAQLGSTPFTIHYGADFATNSLVGGNDVVLVVPEPATAGLVGLCVTAALMMRRRRGLQGRL